MYRAHRKRPRQPHCVHTVLQLIFNVYRPTEWVVVIDGGLQIVCDTLFYPTLERRPSCVCVRFSQGITRFIMKSTKTTI